jgi:putative membrane protein
MMGYGSGMGGWAMALVTMGNLVFWVIVIAGVVVAVRHLGRGTSRGAAVPAPPPAERLLAERFARGEIDEEEYTRRLVVLNSTQLT